MCTTQVWLQAFAWSEKGKAKRLRARQAAAADLPALRDAPMYCFETAVKMFYWNTLIYRYHSDADDKEVTVPPVSIVWTS